LFTVLIEFLFFDLALPICLCYAVYGVAPLQFPRHL